MSDLVNREYVDRLIRLIHSDKLDKSFLITEGETGVSKNLFNKDSGEIVYNSYFDANGSYKTDKTIYYTTGNIAVNPSTSYALTDHEIYTTGSKNLYNKDSADIIIDTYFNSTGVFKTGSTSYYTTGYIALKPSTSYALTDYAITANCAICFFDNNQVLISYLNGTQLSATNGVFTSPSNANYVKLTGRKLYIATNQLEEGTVITSLVAYAEGSTASICFFDGEQMLVSYITGTTLKNQNGVFTAPESASYIRLTGNITNISTNQLEQGISITPYEPYIQTSEGTDRIADLESRVSEFENAITPTISPNPLNDVNVYKLDIADKNGSYTTPNLMPQVAGGGTTDPNLLNSVTPEMTTFFNISKNLFNGNIYTGRLNNGVLDGDTAYWSTNHISVVNSAGKYITSFVKDGTANRSLAYAFYNDGVYVSGRNFTYTDFILIPSDVTTVRVSLSSYDDAIVWYIGIVDSNTALPEYDVYYKRIARVNEFHYTSYYGKHLVTFGDSITDQNRWQPYLIKKFGFKKHTKLGIGGTYISNNGATDPEGNARWFCSDYRISTIPADADVIIVMGGTNDCGNATAGVALGDLTYPFVDTTFMGAVALTIAKIQARCPNALLIFVTPPAGRGNVDGNGVAVNMTAFITNLRGLTTLDYVNAMQTVCTALGVPCIDIFRKSGINQFNRASYISDTVHPNLIGAKKIASVIAGDMSVLEPFA